MRGRQTCQCQNILTNSSLWSLKISPFGPCRLSKLHLLPAAGPFDRFGLWTTNVPTSCWWLFGLCLAMLCVTYEKIMCDISSHVRAPGCTCCRSCCCCRVRSVQIKTQATRGLAVLCCIIVWRSGFGASLWRCRCSARCGPTHIRTQHSSENQLATTRAYRTSKCDGKFLHMAGHRATYRCIFVESEQIRKYFNFEKLGERQTEKLQVFPQTAKGKFPKSAKTLQH